MVETFPPYAAQEAFTDGIRLGSAVRRSQDLDSTTRRHPSEGVPIFAVAIPDQKARHLPKRCRLPQLLCHPRVCGPTRHREMDDAPRGQVDDEKEINRTKPEVNDRQKVAGPDVFRVILQEGRPGRREWLGGTNRADVFLNRALGDGETEFEEFPVDALGAPQTILLCHLLNQRDGCRVQFWTTTAAARLESPEETETLAMPAQQSVRFEEEERIFPVLDATNQEDEPKAIRLRKGWLVDSALQDDQLLPEQGVLGNEIGSAARQVGGDAEHKRMAGGLGEMPEGLFKRRDQTDNQLDEQMQEGRHVR